MEKLHGILGATSLPEIARPVEKLNAVMMQPSAEKGAVSLFKIVRGIIAEPVNFAVEETTEITSAAGPATVKKAQPRSMESRIAEGLAQVPVSPPASPMELNEHIPLPKPCYYPNRN